MEGARLTRDELTQLYEEALADFFNTSVQIPLYYCRTCDEFIWVEDVREEHSSELHSVADVPRLTSLGLEQNAEMSVFFMVEVAQRWKDKQAAKASVSAVAKKARQKMERHFNELTQKEFEATLHLGNETETMMPRVPIDVVNKAKHRHDSSDPSPSSDAQSQESQPGKTTEETSESSTSSSASSRQHEPSSPSPSPIAPPSHSSSPSPPDSSPPDQPSSPPAPPEDPEHH